MFKILFLFVIIGSISAANFRYKRDGNDYVIVDEQDHNQLDELESKYSDGLRSDSNYNNHMESDSLGLSGYRSEDTTHSAAIKTQRYHRVIPFPTSHEDISQHVIEIEPYRQPFRVVFKTESNPLTVQQIHSGLSGHTEHTQSEDEPHRVTHRVFRPVIQEIREIIQPYRRVRQEVRPVLEEHYTIVAQKDKERREERTSYGYRKRGELYSPANTLSQNEKPGHSEEQYTTKTSGEYDMDLADDYSHRKGKYQTRVDSSDQKLTNAKINKQLYQTEFTSILEQMQRIMGKDSLKTKTTPMTNNGITPLLSLNSGKVQIGRKDEIRPIYSD